MLTVTDIITIIKKIIDISLVWLIFYFILKNIRNNVKLTLLFKGIAFIVVLKIISVMSNAVINRLILMVGVDCVHINLRVDVQRLTLLVNFFTVHR